MTDLGEGYGGPADHDCPRELDVVNAVLGGTWPHGCDDSLVAHAQHCGTCREVAQVSMLLHEDVDHARIDVIVPAAGQIWWRAAVRARLESTHAAARPMSWMHAITGAIVVGVFLAAVTAVWPMLPGAISMVRALSLEIFPSAAVAKAIAGGLTQIAGLAIIAVALMVIAPLALYFVRRRDVGARSPLRQGGDEGRRNAAVRACRLQLVWIHGRQCLRG